MNLRDVKIIPKIITRDRRRGNYTVAATIKAGSITRDKALLLGKAINDAMRDLGLVGVVGLKYVIGTKGSKDASKL